MVGNLGRSPKVIRKEYMMMVGRITREMDRFKEPRNRGKKMEALLAD